MMGCGIHSAHAVPKVWVFRDTKLVICPIRNLGVAPVLERICSHITPLRVRHPNMARVNQPHCSFPLWRRLQMTISMLQVVCNGGRI